MIAEVCKQYILFYTINCYFCNNINSHIHVESALLIPYMCTLYNLCKYKVSIRHTICITVETTKLASKDIKETTLKSLREEVQNNAGLDIATVLVAFATKFSPFATENSSAVATLRPVFT